MKPSGPPGWADWRCWHLWVIGLAFVSLLGSPCSLLRPLWFRTCLLTLKGLRNSWQHLLSKPPPPIPCITRAFSAEETGVHPGEEPDWDCSGAELGLNAEFFVVTEAPPSFSFSMPVEGAARRFFSQSQVQAIRQPQAQPGTRGCVVVRVMCRNAL